MAAAVTATVVGEDTVSKTPQGDNVRRVKYVVVKTAATVDATDTVPITLSKYGINTVLGVELWAHSTTNSVIITEVVVTTVVAGGVLTVTIPAGTNDDLRIIKVWFI